jgi:bifunctional non-homologous end joining protein LigD
MFNDHETGDGEAFRRAACKHGLEGIVSKRADRPYLPDDRSAWVKTKCLNRAEFVIVGWTDPEGSRPFLGALLLGYYDKTVACFVRAGSGRECRRRRSHSSTAV